MRIPKSTIVMTLVCAVPFGLAIRDTIRHKDPLSFMTEATDTDTVENPELEAQLAKEETERAASEAAHKAATAAARAAVFGPSSGAMGRMFADIKLGDPTATAMQKYGELHTDGANLGVDFEYAGGKLSGISVKLLEDCDAFADTLDSAWGGANGVWTNGDSQVRATMDRSACMLHFERFADAATWVKALPIAAVGKTAETLRTQLGDRVTDSDDTGFGWRDVGVGTGTGETAYEANVERGKLVSLSASVMADPQTSDEILIAMKKQFGEPSVDDSLTVFTWKRKGVPIRLELPGDHVVLQVGSM